ncbi:MAG TPA: hybrid sensor histidine kinase/response regulator [Allosphingosinicella sp.]|nr:hybrid sensor histidine kinase/response regulator [Allosphingosinicella sp.]
MIYRVVLAEDQAGDRKIFRALIEGIAGLPDVFDETWRVEEYEDADSAIDLLENPPPGAAPNLLVCDLDFSGQMQGMRLIECASGLDVPVPTIVLSQSSDRSVRSDCLRRGAVAFVNKLELSQFDAAKLRDAFLDALALSDAFRAIRAATDWQPVLYGIRSLGHDLLRPLDACVQKLQELVNSNEFSDKHAGDIRTLYQGTDFARRIVQDFTEADILVGPEKTNTPFSLRALLGRTVASSQDHWRQRYRKEELQLDMKVTGTMMCLGDEIRIERAVANVLDNAVKFALPNAEISIEFENYWGDGGEPFWAMVISDNGPGVPAEQLSKLATPLLRLEHTSKLPGMGFGLFSCQALLAPYSDGLGVPNPRFNNRSPGPGLEVTVFIPRADSASPAG